VRLPRQASELVIRVVKRQAPVFVIALAAACVAAGTATGDPSIGAKRAQAQQVMAQISQLDSNLERARTLYVSSTQKLHVIEHNLKINKVALRAARSNLKRSQHTLMQRLVTIYTTRDDQSTLAVLLGATSIDDLVNRIETVQSVSAQDLAVLHEVVGFKKAVTRTRHALTVAHRAQQQLVQQRAAAKARIG
jgi:peptidoglycan hydrolase CwlO-like protein